MSLRSGKELINTLPPRVVLLTIVASTFAVTGLASAAASISVSATKGLTDGQSVTVTASGLATNSTGALLECNNDPNQPTVTVAGNQVPVSCSNPLSKVLTTDKNGNLAATAFVVHTGTVGPAGSGTDSAGNDAAADAAKYPCPPTPAQITAGDSCDITFGDDHNDDVIQNITFASQTTTTPAPTPAAGSNSSQQNSSSAPTPTAPVSNSTTPTSLSNTGPGTAATIALFLAAVSAGSLAYYYHVLRSQSPK